MGGVCSWAVAWRALVNNTTGHNVARRVSLVTGGGIDSVYSAFPCVQEDGWHVMRRAFCEVRVVGQSTAFNCSEAEAAQAATQPKETRRQASRMTAYAITCLHPRGRH
jgi:uncharacterized protein YdaU (DUF1376 family)